MANSKSSGKKRKRSGSRDSSHKKRRRTERDHKRKGTKRRSSSSSDSSDSATKEKRQHRKISHKKREKSPKHSEKRESRKFIPDPTEIERKRLVEESEKKAALEAEHKQLVAGAEEERKKRRERVHAWQEQFKKEVSEETVPTKTWTFDDEKDEEEPEISATVAPPEYTDDIDPLDVYMKGIKESLTQNPTTNTEKPHIVETVITAHNRENEPEILEQFGDTAEYSSEDEIPETSAIPLSKKNIKILPTIDHKTIIYPPFRKKFYVEVPELTKMSDAEVAAYRLELEGIIVKGRGCPKPIKKWVQIGANPIVLTVLRRLGYERPTPIQAQAVSAAMSGRDVIGIAKTGSGKTLAYLLSLFRHVLDQPPLSEGEGPIALVLTPTRELALQVLKECRKFAKPLNLKAIALFGGSVVAEQIAELKRGTEIAVCTPGRLIDMLAVNSGRVTNCRRVTFVVIDEADRMFDMGFEPQVHKILQQVRPDRQLLLFTATFPPSMETLARRVLTKPIEIVVGTRNKVCADVKQHLLLLDSENKFLKLLEILGVCCDLGPVLIFVDRQDAADELVKDLLTKGYPCMSLHGGRDQYDRDSTLQDFKNGVCGILVATSVAARGIDVKNVSLVINYDCPNHGEDYVHRCGRTGRAGRKGTAITFITGKDARYLKDIISVVENTDCEIPQSIISLYQRFVALDRKHRSKTSGFGGRGYKFDEIEMSHSAENRNMIKWTFGWQDSGDEADEEERVLRKIETQMEKAFGSRPKATSAKPTACVDKEKMDKVQSIASRLNEKLRAANNEEAFAQVVQPIKRPKVDESKKTPGLELVEKIARKLNMKVNYEAMAPASKPDVTRKLAIGEVYFEEIDINDFPQLARQRITSKEALDGIAEMADCSLTVRGAYCAAGKAIEMTDRRLHLLIEGDTEFKVQIAKAEAKRVIKEECIKSDYAFIQPSSRYKIT